MPTPRVETLLVAFERLLSERDLNAMQRLLRGQDRRLGLPVAAAQPNGLARALG